MPFSSTEVPTYGARLRGSAVFLTPKGAFLGIGSNSDQEMTAVPLLEKDEANHFRPRSGRVLEKLLTLGYGTSVRLPVQQLKALASALNQDDIKAARLLVDRLGLPRLPSLTRARLMTEADRISLLAKIALGALRPPQPRLPKGMHGGGQFTFVSGSGESAGKFAALEADLKNPHVQAFLNTIAQAEGATYDTAFGGGKFKDFSKFPGYGKDNTASGRYQILAATYDYLSGKMGLKDFSPRTQDLMAVQLLNETGAMKFIREGNLDAALAGASRTWASLPQSPKEGGRYGQRYMPYKTVRSTFDVNHLP